MKKKKNTTKCTQEIRSVPPERYRLAKDGKKWRAVCRERREVLMQLATYANGDGSSIRVSVERVANELGISRSTAFYRLADLRGLGFLLDGDVDPKYRTIIRSIDVAKVTAIPVHPVQNSETPSRIARVPVQNGRGTRPK